MLELTADDWAQVGQRLDFGCAYEIPEGGHALIFIEHEHIDGLLNGCKVDVIDDDTSEIALHFSATNFNRPGVHRITFHMTSPRRFRVRCGGTKKRLSRARLQVQLRRTPIDG